MISTSRHGREATSLAAIWTAALPHETTSDWGALAPTSRPSPRPRPSVRQEACVCASPRSYVRDAGRRVDMIALQCGRLNEVWLGCSIFCVFGCWEYISRTTATPDETNILFKRMLVAEPSLYSCALTTPSRALVRQSEVHCRRGTIAQRSAPAQKVSIAMECAARASKKTSAVCAVATTRRAGAV